MVANRIQDFAGIERAENVRSIQMVYLSACRTHPLAVLIRYNVLAGRSGPMRCMVGISRNVGTTGRNESGCYLLMRAADDFDNTVRHSRY